MTHTQPAEQRPDALSVLLVPLPRDLIKRIAAVLFHSGRPADWEAFRMFSKPLRNSNIEDSQ